MTCFHLCVISTLNKFLNKKNLKTKTKQLCVHYESWTIMTSCLIITVAKEQRTTTLQRRLIRRRELSVILTSFTYFRITCNRKEHINGSAKKKIYHGISCPRRGHPGSRDHGYKEIIWKCLSKWMWSPNMYTVPCTKTHRTKLEARFKITGRTYRQTDEHTHKPEIVYHSIKKSGISFTVCHIKGRQTMYLFFCLFCFSFFFGKRWLHFSTNYPPLDVCIVWICLTLNIFNQPQV